MYKRDLALNNPQWLIDMPKNKTFKQGPYICLSFSLY